MKEKNVKSPQEKGITLIALVVTIVVLLILAGVSITVLFGDSGIIKMAQEAAQKTQEAADKDNEDLGKLDEYLTSGKWGTGVDTSKIEYDKNNPTKGTKIEGTNADWKETVNGKEQVAKIPVGFSVVKDVETDINNIQNGLVISDVAEDDLDNTAGGNQFVWIPVEDFSKFVRIEGFEYGTRQTMLKNCKEAGKEGAEITTPESIEMYQSVKDNKGFYIARYEAGLVGKGEVTEGEDEDYVNTTYYEEILTSKKGVDPSNKLPWSFSKEVGTDGLKGDDNEKGAVKKSREMYTKSNLCGVVSTLCYGVQWDAAMQFIEPNYFMEGNEEKVTNKTVVNDGEKRGNYASSWRGGSTHKTGTHKEYEFNHIYDLAGNLEEWTMEFYETYDDRDWRVTRGGDAGDEVLGYGASTREEEFLSTKGYGSGPGGSATWAPGFRVALYVVSATNE